jgi:hypothetical protein
MAIAFAYLDIILRNVANHLLKWRGKLSKSDIFPGPIQQNFKSKIKVVNHLPLNLKNNSDLISDKTTIIWTALS